MAQTSYTASPAVAYAGLEGDIQPARKAAKVNEESSAIPFGVAVKRGTSENKAKLPATAADEIIGVVLSTYAADNQALAQAAGVAAAGQMTIIEEGDVFVKVEEAVAVGDQVFVRFASGSGTQLGAFRKSIDSSTARRLPGAVYETAAAQDGYALVRLGKTVDGHTELQTLSYDHAVATDVDQTTKIFTTPPDRSFVIDSVGYTNPTGLAQDATNVFNIKVMNGSNVAANWDTTTGQQGTLTADTPVELVKGTLANRTVPPATTVSLFLDHSGTQTLPAGRVWIRGYYL
jgi:hypothetical protein